jgi:tripartite ATP-independent transporter DctM subunit
MLEKIKSLKYVGAMLALFIFVMGGIYFGVFTPYEAGALGSFGAIVITAIGGRLTVKKLGNSLLQAGQVTGMIIVLIVGAFVFMRFLAVSKLPFAISDFMVGLVFSPYVVFSIIVIFYILLGMFLDIMAGIILTIPIVFPMIVALGFDPIWFGVIVVLIMEMGLITPPMGMNVFILSGITKVPVSTMFRGVIPFVFAMIGLIIVLTIFPQLVLFIPNMMK